jgi:hypothetical protein
MFVGQATGATVAKAVLEEAPTKPAIWMSSLSSWSA